MVCTRSPWPHPPFGRNTKIIKARIEQVGQATLRQWPFKYYLHNLFNARAFYLILLQKQGKQSDFAKAGFSGDSIYRRPPPH